MGVLEFIGYGVLGAVCWDIIKLLVVLIWNAGSRFLHAIAEGLGDSSIS